MKTIYFTILSLFLWNAVFAQKQADPAVRQILATQQAAWNRGDIDNFMVGYWENDSLLFVGNTLDRSPGGPHDAMATGKAGIERSQRFRTKGLGYFAEQSTQPQTLGYSLSDSPVGLLAWIYEKLVLWTDDYKWTDDEGTRMLTYLVYYSPALRQC